MPVNYLDLRSQIKSFADRASQRKQELSHKHEDCLSLLQKHNDDLINLQHLVEDEVSRNKVLRCAVPTTEPLMSRTAYVPGSPACTIFAADGSQIDPDPHGSVLFGLVNVGVFTMRTCSGQAPKTETYSELYDEEVLDEENAILTEELVALMRDVYERQVLAKLTKNLSAPVVTLTDGSLELFHEPRKKSSHDNQFKKYLAALDDLALNGTITAGYVDRPHADLVVRLLELLIDQHDPQDHPFAGITDLALFQTILKPGERSSVFRVQSSSAELYEGKKSLHFFYLNVGTAKEPALARVEVPLWVVEKPGSMTLLHTILIEQAHQAGERPYPYPLIRAHDIAVVRMDDREQVFTLIENELIQRGFSPMQNSNKQFSKQSYKRKRYG